MEYLNFYGRKPLNERFSIGGGAESRTPVRECFTWRVYDV